YAATGRSHRKQDWTIRIVHCRIEQPMFPRINAVVEHMLSGPLDVLFYRVDGDQPARHRIDALESLIRTDTLRPVACPTIDHYKATARFESRSEPADGLEPRLTVIDDWISCMGATIDAALRVFGKVDPELRVGEGAEKVD